MYNSNDSTSSYISEGSNIKAYYDKNNPSKMRTTSSSGGIIMRIFGIPFCAIGLGMLFNKLNKIIGKKTLLENRQRILVDLQEVTINYSYSVNNRTSLFNNMPRIRYEWRELYF